MADQANAVEEASSSWWIVIALFFSVLAVIGAVIVASTVFVQIRSQIQQLQLDYKTAVGPKGYTGAQGEYGMLGIIGMAGPAGAVGGNPPAGPTGVSGTNVSVGARGPAGAIHIGVTGATGPRMNTGPTGPTGPVGRTGLQGAQGVRGQFGETGMTGATGASGAPGVAGVTGATGHTGMTGVLGETGGTGASGETGLPGFDRDTGATGARGGTGDTGPDGPFTNTGPTGPESLDFGVSALDAGSLSVATDRGLEIMTGFCYAQLMLPNPSPTAPGFMGINTQTMGGRKYFQDGLSVTGAGFFAIPVIGTGGAMLYTNSTGGVTGWYAQTGPIPSTIVMRDNLGRISSNGDVTLQFLQMGKNDTQAVTAVSVAVTWNVIQFIGLVNIVNGTTFSCPVPGIYNISWTLNSSTPTMVQGVQTWIVTTSYTGTYIKSQTVDPAINGAITIPMYQPNDLIQIFASSTLTDTFITGGTLSISLVQTFP
jgi:hypothetical protein